MSIAKPRMRPLKVSPSQIRQVRTQFGALCYRTRPGKVQVLLVTSRVSGRWIMPKGWPVPGATPTDAALREAWEEAGVRGRVMGNSLGIYSYVKRDDGADLPCVVAVFPIKVRELERIYPEAGQRKRKWFSLKRAAEVLQEPELQQIVRDFEPKFLGR